MNFLNYLYIMMDSKEQIENCEHKFEWLDFGKTYLNIDNSLKLLAGETRK